MNKLISVAVLSVALSCGAANAAPAYYSAKQILMEGASTGDGIYTIDPDGEGGDADFDIFADMTTAGGGWTLGLLSLEGSPSASTDMVTNTGTASLSSAHTRNLTELAINQDAQIRYVMYEDGSVLFDGYYTGNYHGTFAEASDWVVLQGTIPTGFNYHEGMDWSTPTNDVDDYSGNCATYNGINQPWYYGACYTLHPTGGWSTNAPYVNGNPIDSWAIYVREETTPAYVGDEGGEDGQVPLPGTLLLLGLGGLLLRRNLY